MLDKAIPGKTLTLMNATREKPLTADNEEKKMREEGLHDPHPSLMNVFRRDTASDRLILVSMARIAINFKYI